MYLHDYIEKSLNFWTQYAKPLAHLYILLCRRKTSKETVLVCGKSYVQSLLCQPFVLEITHFFCMHFTCGNTIRVDHHSELSLKLHSWCTHDCERVHSMHMPARSSPGEATVFNSPPPAVIRNKWALPLDKLHFIISVLYTQHFSGTNQQTVE